MTVAGNWVSDNVTHRFGKRYVLKGFSFKVEPFKIMFLAGENGAGKTTWVRIATGLLKPTQGAVLYNGLKVAEFRKNLAVAFDEPPVYPNLNGFGNLSLLSGIAKVNKEWETYVLDALKLDDNLLKQKAKGYSLGQRHRLAVAAALLRQPLYLILDEPTIGLDPFSWELVSNCLRQLADKGTAIILTGQNFSLLEKLIDEITILHNGQAVFSGPPTELTSRCPTTVRVRGHNLEEVKNAFLNYRMSNDSKGSFLEVICDSIAEAEETVSKLQRLQIPLYEMVIQHNTLEEAFKNIVREGEKYEDND
jgi:ABC-2 type transport system ATP-binding protein/Cu-processing system ATP-binding protein